MFVVYLPAPSIEAMLDMGASSQARCDLESCIDCERERLMAMDRNWNLCQPVILREIEPHCYLGFRIMLRPKLGDTIGYPKIPSGPSFYSNFPR